MMPTQLNDLNRFSRDEFVATVGPTFEHSPWIAAAALDRRPFESIEALHAAMCGVVASATMEQQIALIAAHPDLVGRLAREGKLTTQSSTEQRAAGLDALSGAEVAAFEKYNADYRARFGFPFVICARLNRKEAILAAFPKRLNNARAEEIATALAEIYKIARLRLDDAIIGNDT